ncbi:MAG TPA: BadF/BadG/BcrA/BcrD ATPase family protein [Ktedonobacteraceae bacterium]|nr:BadF/BadG/BcrA/BcrD ATPase family protein [Ktedonobacteraceae bacterium]
MMHDFSGHLADAYFVGVDGGGSKTLAVIVDAQGRERGRALAGSGNHAVVGLEQAASQLRVAVERAAQAAGCSPLLRAAWFGVAGIDSLHDHDQLFPHLSPLAETVLLTNDAELVLGALDNRVGVALIAGTGTIGLGRNAEGDFARASGWGHLLSEEGSGYELGRQALVAAVRAADGRGPQTLLLDSILEHWHLRDPAGILAQVYPAADKAKIARLSALVFAAAQADDIVASRIVQRAVNELALVVTTVSDKLHFFAQPLPLALGGSLLVHEADYRERVLHHLRARLPLGQLAVVDQPALIAARAAIQLVPVEKGSRKET